MTNITENIDNEYFRMAVTVIRENNKCPDVKAVKDYINKNFPIDVEEELFEGVVIQLLPALMMILKLKF